MACAIIFSADLPQANHRRQKTQPCRQGGSSHTGTRCAYTRGGSGPTELGVHMETELTGIKAWPGCPATLHALCTSKLSMKSHRSHEGQTPPRVSQCLLPSATLANPQGSPSTFSICNGHATTPILESFPRGCWARSKPTQSPGTHPIPREPPDSSPAEPHGAPCSAELQEPWSPGLGGHRASSQHRARPLRPALLLKTAMGFTLSHGDWLNTVNYSLSLSCAARLSPS